MENILKQGYLKRARPLAADSTRRSICSSILQRLEPKNWYVFVVRENVPYLEIFDKEDSFFTGHPSSRLDLTECFKVTYTLARTNKVWTFCIFLPGIIHDFEAETRDQMLQWSQILERTLRNYGKIRESNEHIYGDFPVQYAPKHTGLDHEEALEAVGAAGQVEESNGCGMNDGECDNDYTEMSEIEFRKMHHKDDTLSPTSSDDLHLGAVGGSKQPFKSPYVNLSITDDLKSPGDADDEISDTDTTDEDLGQDFWLRHKKDSTLQRYEGQTPLTTSLIEMDRPNIANDKRAMATSMPPLPGRKEQDRGFPSFITNSDYKMPANPVAPPRKKRDANKNTGNVTISNKSKSVKNVDVSHLDDGYELVANLKKESSDPWTDSLDQCNSIEEYSKSLFNQGADLVVKLPPEQTESCCKETNVKSSQISPREESKKTKKATKKSRSSSGHEDLINLTDSRTSDSVIDNSYSDFPFTKQISKISVSHNPDDSVFCDSTSLQQLRDSRCKSKDEKDENFNNFNGSTDETDNVVPPLPQLPNKTNKREEVIYDFGGSGAAFSKKNVPKEVTKPKSESQATNTLNQRQYSEKDSLYSIPKHAKPVAGLSTEEVQENCQESQATSHPAKHVGPEDLKLLYAQPHKGPLSKKTDKPSNDQDPPPLPEGRKLEMKVEKHSKDGSASHKIDKSSNEIPPPLPESRKSDPKVEKHFKDFSSSHKIEKSSNEIPPPLPESRKSDLKVERYFKDLSSSQNLKSSHNNRQSSHSPTDTVLVQRPLPSLPDRRTEPVNLDTDVFNADRVSSPSHDGFKFDFVADQRLKSSSSSDAVNKRPSQPLPNTLEGNDDIYEDATGRHHAPALPPRRSMKGRSTANRAVSVYIPKKSQDQSLTNRPGISRPASQDDAVVIRSSLQGISRQFSLTERQQIRQSGSAFSVVPLKQSQVELLQDEKQQPGVEIDIGLKSTQGLALVECFNGVWIGGWDFHRFPRLADRVHIGDQLLEVEGIRITNMSHAYKVFKMTKSERVVMVIRRLPYAHIVAIRRSIDKERLGFTRENGTAEISYMDPSGLAATSGLPRRAKTLDGTGECNWMLTEINCRPLNLSYKNNEVQHLLNAVGKDISIVVQPVDFVKMLKKQLKRNKTYKDFLAP